MAFLGFVILIGNQLLSPGLGLDPATVHDISIAVGIAGTALTILQPNANQPTVPPGHVIVPASAVKPEAANQVVFKRAA